MSVKYRIFNLLKVLNKGYNREFYVWCISRFNFLIVDNLFCISCGCNM